MVDVSFESPFYQAHLFLGAMLFDWFINIIIKIDSFTVLKRGRLLDTFPVFNNQANDFMSQGT